MGIIQPIELEKGYCEHGASLTQAVSLEEQKIDQVSVGSRIVCGCPLNCPKVGGRYSVDG